jgi:hypothetical protein
MRCFTPKEWKSPCFLAKQPRAILNCLLLADSLISRIVRHSLAFSSGFPIISRIVQMLSHTVAFMHFPAAFHSLLAVPSGFPTAFKSLSRQKFVKQAISVPFPRSSLFTFLNIKNQSRTGKVL